MYVQDSLKNNVLPDNIGRGRHKKTRRYTLLVARKVLQKPSQLRSALHIYPSMLMIKY